MKPGMNPGEAAGLADETLVSSVWAEIQLNSTKSLFFFQKAQILFSYLK